MVCPWSHYEVTVFDLKGLYLFEIAVNSVRAEVPYRTTCIQVLLPMFHRLLGVKWLSLTTAVVELHYLTIVLQFYDGLALETCFWVFKCTEIGYFSGLVSWPLVVDKKVCHCTSWVFPCIVGRPKGIDRLIFKLCIGISLCDLRILGSQNKWLCGIVVAILNCSWSSCDHKLRYIFLTFIWIFVSTLRTMQIWDCCTLAKVRRQGSQVHLIIFCFLVYTPFTFSLVPRPVDSWSRAKWHNFRFRGVLERCLSCYPSIIIGEVLFLQTLNRCWSFFIQFSSCRGSNLRLLFFLGWLERRRSLAPNLRLFPWRHNFPIDLEYKSFARWIL